MIVKILIGWLVFDIIVYAVMWFENIYYEKDLRTFFHKLLSSFTEEE